MVPGRSGRLNAVPRIVGRIRRKHPVEVRDAQFLRAHTDPQIKITVPGPFTMTQQAHNEFYPSEEAAALDYAAAVNEEIKDLFAAGADVVQIDEPYMQAEPEKARQYGVTALNRALDGVRGATAVHICFGYAAMVPGKPSRLCVSSRTGGMQRATNLGRNRAVFSRLFRARKSCQAKRSSSAFSIFPPTRSRRPQIVADRIRRALPFVPPERMILAPDCGMKYLPREVAFGKLQAMVQAAAWYARKFRLGRAADVR